MEQPSGTLKKSCKVNGLFVSSREDMGDKDIGTDIGIDKDIGRQGIVPDNCEDSSSRP